MGAIGAALTGGALMEHIDIRLAQLEQLVKSGFHAVERRQDEQSAEQRRMHTDNQASMTRIEDQARITNSRLSKVEVKADRAVADIETIFADQKQVRERLNVIESLKPVLEWARNQAKDILNLPDHAGTHTGDEQFVTRSDFRWFWVIAAASAAVVIYLFTEFHK